MTRFRVLGPLLVEGQESPTLRAQMVRRLLAALLCRPNAVVPVEELTTALWGGQAPPTARKTLQVYVRRLRTALGDEGRIVSEPAGYRIVAAPGELDSREFADLVSNGRFRTALELWRGPAFEDVRDHPPISDEAHRLDEERLRIEARSARHELESGRHAELVPRLRKLIEIHQYHEEFRAHLMLALYRCSRQSEALDLYRNTRKLLDEELGVSPSPELQRLHEAILRADAALNLPSQQAVPRELPADITRFVGRTDPLRALDDMLPDSSPVVISAIAGSAGVGKTTLAVHWAHSVADRFPDGQLYVNLRGFDPVGHPLNSEEAIRRFLDALGVSPQRIPASAEAQASLYRSLLADKRMLVVLDNARDAKQVRPLLPGSPHCLVLVTSRSRMASLVATSGARPLMLDVLTQAEARELLAARLGAARVSAEPEAIEEIITRCARLPLALAIAASHAATRPDLSLVTLADELRDLHAFDSDDPLTDLHAVFSWSYRRLSVPATRLFRLLGLHPGPDISTQAAASLAGQPVDALLDELTQAHLVTEHTPGRYTFHDLLRAYAIELVSGSDNEALERLFDHYAHTAYTATMLLSRARVPITLLKPHAHAASKSVTTFEQAMAWFAAERQVLMATIHRAAEAGFETHAWQLTWAIYTFLTRQGCWHDLRLALETTLTAVQRLNDKAAEAWTQRSLARIHADQGQFDQAYSCLTNALSLCQQLGDHFGQAQAHLGLGGVSERQGRYEEAIKHDRQALALSRCIDQPLWSARILNAFGWHHALLGDHQSALLHCQRALTLFQELADPWAEAGTWDSLGYAHRHLNHHDEAIACYKNGLKLYRQVGDRYYEAEVLTYLGETLQADGDVGGAVDAWRQALSIFTDLDHPNADDVRSKLDHTLDVEPAS